MAYDATSHAGDPDVDVAANAAGPEERRVERRAEQTAVGALTSELRALVRRTINDELMVMPAETEIEVLRRTNRELEITVYILAGILILIWLARR